MAKNQIEISVQQEMESLGQALRRVTSAVFADQPGVAASIKGKRKSTQFTFKVTSGTNRGDLKKRANQALLNQIFVQHPTQVEQHMKRAFIAVIAGLVGAKNANVRVFGRSLGNAKPHRPLEQEGFVKFIKSKAGAGEIGLPDPDEALRKLKAALLQAVTVDVIVRRDGPQIKFTFDQKRLLKLTPHPNRFEDGIKGPFFSWLSLVTGPDFVSGGTPGFSLIRVSDIRASLRRSIEHSARGINARRTNIAGGLIRASRTRGNAGELAGIMMSNKSLRGGKSPAEAFGGKTDDYRPSARFRGFWDQWWMQNKIELNMWARKIMSATIRGLLKK